MDKKFCPKCKTMTMIPTEKIPLNKEEFNWLEPRALAFEGEVLPYLCSGCFHIRYDPVVRCGHGDQAS